MTEDLVAPERGDVNEVDRGVIKLIFKEINPSVSLTLDSSPERGAEAVPHNFAEW